MQVDTATLPVLEAALERLQRALPAMPETAPAGDAGLADVLAEVAGRLGDTYPFGHPLYAGQMLKPPHPVARLAYTLALQLNCNNHALDGGRATSAMEKEAVAALAALFGWGERYLGHLTGGGTMANLEALWVAGRLAPGKAVLACEQAHYTHSRLSSVLGLPFRAVAADERGRLSVTALQREFERGDVGTVVATLGSTGLGAVDPLPEILTVARDSGVRVHVDAAYGGYFSLADNLEPGTAAAFAAIGAADSIVIDPHKHGLQPYGCGCVLFRDPAVGRFYSHGSPYTYFTSDELHLGEISLECSRPGAAAVALWATQRLLPYDAGGRFAAELSRCRAAALALHERLGADPESLTLPPPELDIVVWAPAAASLEAVSARSRAVFDACARRDLHLALMEMPADFVGPCWPAVRRDADAVVCLRSCLMKPEHSDWIGAIVDRYREALAECTA